MALGTAVFLSTLLLGLILLFWITKDRVRWNRIIYWFAGITAVIIAALLLYDNYEPPLTKQTGYADLELGMTQATVKYVKGSPTDVHKGPQRRDASVSKPDEGRPAEDFRAWSYDIGEGKLYVDFDAEKRVKAIRCFSTSIAECPEVLGLWGGTSEERVIERLGEPTQAAVDGAIKRMIYKPLNLMFDLAEKKVLMTHITEDLPKLPETTSGE